MASRQRAEIEKVETHESIKVLDKQKNILAIKLANKNMPEDCVKYARQLHPNKGTTVEHQSAQKAQLRERERERREKQMENFQQCSLQIYHAKELETKVLPYFVPFHFFPLVTLIIS